MRGREVTGCGRHAVISGGRVGGAAGNLKNPANAPALLPWRHTTDVMVFYDGASEDDNRGPDMCPLSVLWLFNPHRCPTEFS